MNKKKNLPAVVCYHTKEPVYYNKGTKWEKTCDRFLLCYAGSTENALEVIAECKANPEYVKKMGVDPNEIKDYFVSYQESMY